MFEEQQRDDEVTKRQIEEKESRTAPPEDDRGQEKEETPAPKLTSVTEQSEDESTIDNLPAQLRDDLQTENDGNSTATVKVVLVPGGHVMTVAFNIGFSIQELKRYLGAELKVPSEILQISLNGKVVEEEQSLMGLGVLPHSSTPMEMSSVDPDTHPLIPPQPREPYNMPDVITVRVQNDNGTAKDVVVEIERARQQKPFQGGYRHRLTGAVYHNAGIQTVPKKRPPKNVEVFRRDTQTVEVRTQYDQCPVSVATQITGIGCYIPGREDRLITPGRYQTAEEYHNLRLKAVICLQSYARRWLSTQAVERLRRQRNLRLAWLDMQEQRRRKEKEVEQEDRRRRWMNPQTKEDINLLYHALEKWRCEQEQKIKSTMRGVERKAALCSLLEQETEYIKTIGWHEIATQNKNNIRAVRHFLNKAAAPYQWRAADGRYIEMDTPNTIRARELRDLYGNITLSDVSKEQRLLDLMTLKSTVEEHTCQLTWDIVELIDREVDMLTRGIKAVKLEGLRSRISTLFLQYIKIPAFNPEVAQLLKVPQDPAQLKNDVFLCLSCNRYLRSADFSWSASIRQNHRCRDCTRLDNIGRSRPDLLVYKNMLKRLRADELMLNEESKIPFLLQVEDMRYLVEALWDSCSALQTSRDLQDLVFVRWQRLIEWSPWNCILLAKEEVSAHWNVEHIHKAYAETFIRRIEQKHVMARRHFKHIPLLNKYMESQAAAAMSDQLVITPIVMETDKPLADTPSATPD
ncbi:IQ motif and ubiquitin-like domain-containing protein isoform 1-T1 [Synchiropus picturatus]